MRIIEQKQVFSRTDNVPTDFKYKVHVLVQVQAFFEYKTIQL